MRRRRLGKSILAVTLAGAVALAGGTSTLADGPGAPPSGDSSGGPGGTPPGDIPGGPGGTPPGDSSGGPGGMPGGGGSSSESVSYSGATTVESEQTLENGTYSSTTADENALLVATSDKVTVNNPTVTKTGDSDGGDNCNFYGINSAIMVKDGSTTTISGGTVTTDATGANGVFSYGGNGGQNGAAGDGTTVNISDTAITTTGNNAGGIMTTGGGKTVASNLTIETSGQSSAAIRTDRGGGTVEVTGGSYTSNGQGSPAIYSTADITVGDAALVSNKSEGVCIEGQNSITLNNCNLTANNNELNGQAQFYDTIMIYQSQSGDAADGTSAFSMTGGTLTSKNGDVFHVTNTEAVINLNGVTITNEDSDNVLLSVCDDGWSGADNVATLNAADQTMGGTLLVGSDSTLNLNLSGATAFTGKTSGVIQNDKDSSSISTSIGTVNVTMAGGSAVWVLTGDTSISTLSGSGKINYNGYTLTVGSTAYTSGSPAEGITETAESAADTTLTTAAPMTAAETSSATTAPVANSSAAPTASAASSAAPVVSASPVASPVSSAAASMAPTASPEATTTGETDTEEEKTSLKTVTFKNTNKTVKYSKVKKKVVSYSVIKKSGGGKVTYQVTKGKKKYITVSTKGKVTVKKGAKKGTYVIKVTVAKKGGYKKTSKSVKVVVK